ncbi:hypothetical protein EXIGLDRAFT_499273, partial [Exidia glandulosa HHB12029]
MLHGAPGHDDIHPVASHHASPHPARACPRIHRRSDARASTRWTNHRARRGVRATAVPTRCSSPPATYPRTHRTMHRRFYSGLIFCLLCTRKARSDLGPLTRQVLHRRTGGAESESVVFARHQRMQGSVPVWDGNLLVANVRRHPCRDDCTRGRDTRAFHPPPAASAFLTSFLHIHSRDTCTDVVLYKLKSITTHNALIEL